MAPESIHLTVKFLGEVPEAQAAAVESVVSDLAGASSPLVLRVAGGGVFPDEKKPRIFWAGLSGDVEKLHRLAEAAADRFAELGFPREDRAFKAHLTVARCRSGARCRIDDSRKFLSATEHLSTPPFQVNALDLVRSHLDAKGVRYESIRRFPLAA